jgi:outer membrane murein-binding lipoprotein Lpp
MPKFKLVSITLLVATILMGNLEPAHSLEAWVTNNDNRHDREIRANLNMIHSIKSMIGFDDAKKNSVLTGQSNNVITKLDNISSDVTTLNKDVETLEGDVKELKDKIAGIKKNIIPKIEDIPNKILEDEKTSKLLNKYAQAILDKNMKAIEEEFKKKYNIE